jgi:hypothetical protein
VILRPHGDDLQLITQADHARLAGAVMQHTAALATHPRRASILLAIAEHDNGWREPDSSPQIDPLTGSPLDFTSAPIAVRQGVWPRGVGRLAHDPWAAALVAQHALAVFERYHGDSAWTRFFAEMEAMRGDMLDASLWPLQELLNDYRFVRLGDVISLTFCNGWTDTQRFDEWSVRLFESQVLVSPDPFDKATVPIEVAARPLRQQAFRTDEELRDACAAAPIAYLRGMVVGEPR